MGSIPVTGSVLIAERYSVSSRLKIGKADRKAEPPTMWEVQRAVALAVMRLSRCGTLLGYQWMERNNTGDITIVIRHGENYEN